jgi:hypothetical protein
VVANEIQDVRRDGGRGSRRYTEEELLAEQGRRRIELAGVARV